MSELIQVKKLLTFEEICPLWAPYYIRILQLRKELRGGSGSYDGLYEEYNIRRRLYEIGLNIADSDRCVVGEAHGWSSGRDCRECYNFAHQGVFQYKQEILDDWVQHWNLAHVTLTGPSDL